MCSDSEEGRQAYITWVKVMINSPDAFILLVLRLEPGLSSVKIPAKIHPVSYSIKRAILCMGIKHQCKILNVIALKKMQIRSFFSIWIKARSLSKV